MASFRYPLEEIREKCDLVEIVSAHVALRKRNKTFEGLCPFHNEKTPSFHVNPDRQFFHCFGCGVGGDVFTFVQKIENVTFAEAAEMLARRAGITIERSADVQRQYSERERIFRANNIACAFYRSMIALSSKAKEYLVQRGLSEDTVEKFRLGYAPDGWDLLTKHLRKERVSEADAVKAGLIIARENSPGYYDRFRDRLMFPILDTSDRVIAFGGRVMGEGEPKYLNSPETPLFSKNKTLYGLNFARRSIGQEDSLLIMEGYMDVIASQAAGFENTVATLGTALTPEHVTIVSRFTKNVVLSFDADSAGIKAALRSAPLFEQSGFNVRILMLPKGEDPDSMLRGGDTSRFSNFLDKALPVPDFRIKLVLMKQDLKTDEGKAAALKDAVSIIADIESVVDRERLIRRLVKYHPNFSTGTTLAEDHLRSEVNRLISRAVRRGPISVQDRTQDTDNRRNRQNKLNLIQRSERILLGIILFRGSDAASKVFSALPPNDFMGEETRALAEVLSRQYTDLGKIDQEDVREKVAGTPAESLLLELLVMPDDSEMDCPVEDAIEAIISHRKIEQQKKMRALARKLQDGSIKSGDPEWEEYWRLVRETKGNKAPRVIRGNATDN